MRLELNLVEIFCSVVEEGSFSRAAEKLRLSQPTVSGHVRNLETLIGVKLLDRLPRGISLTHAGKLLYKHGVAIRNEKDSAIRALKQLLNSEQGELLLSGSTIPAEYILPPIIASFRTEFPRIKVEMRISDSEQACADILAGRTELGFVGAAVNSNEIEFHHFDWDELALIVPNTQEWHNVRSIDLEELAIKPFLARESGSGTRRAFEKILGHSLDNFNVVGCLGSTGAIKEALKAHIGVSVLSVLAVGTELAGGLLKRVAIKGVESMKREFYIAKKRRVSLSPVAEAFLDHAVPANGARATIRSLYAESGKPDDRKR
jgi:DNA-binding transcriptional LysR family regulator